MTEVGRAKIKYQFLPVFAGDPMMIIRSLLFPPAFRIALIAFLVHLLYFSMFSAILSLHFVGHVKCFLFLSTQSYFCPHSEYTPIDRKNDFSKPDPYFSSASFTLFIHEGQITH